MKISELAKELKMENKDVVALAKKLKIDAKSAASNLSDEDVEKIKKENSKSQEKSSKKEEKVQPYIIRREVILKDEEAEKLEQEKKKKEEHSKDLGFNQKRNTEYNIVYRNKPNKPLSVKELFGLGAKEEKKPEAKAEPAKVAPKAEPVKEVKSENVSKEVKPSNDNQNRDFKRRDNNFGNRNGEFNKGPRNNNGGQNNRFNNNNQGNRNFNNQNNNFRKNNEEITKNYNDMIEGDVSASKEGARSFSARAIDKQKLNNKYDETKQKRATKKSKGGWEDYDEGKLKNLKRSDNLSNMYSDQEGGMLDYYDLSSGRKNHKQKKLKDQGESKQKIFALTQIKISENISVKDLAAELKKTSSEVIMKLLDLGIMATINQIVDFDTAFLIAQEYGVTAIKKEVVNEEDVLFDESEDRPEDLTDRAPVVVVMGHVDHGKTSLLDAIRNTNVIEGEAGGITQKIGAYKVKVNDREITFLDTPGHEAFTSMRARGAQITDIAILIVAADDGVMPQTVEAINHAKAAEIPIIVAINKIDVPGANPEKVKQELLKYDLVPEEWGGDTIFCEISAKKKINIEGLLEMVLLVADMKELKTNNKKQAKGVIIEAKLDKAMGPIASVLVQRGKLKVGDTVVVGTSIGRIRSMEDDKGKKIKEAGASTPAKITGLTSVPEAGDTFYVVKNEKIAKKLIEKREQKAREEAMNAYNKVTLNNLFDRMAHDNVKQLNIIVKADVQGSAEALKQSLEKLSTEEVEVSVIHSSTGAINESDVNLAKAAKAIIIGFNVRPTNTAKDIAEKSEVEVKLYSVIYQALEDVEDAMNGLLDPIYEEKVIGNVEVRQVFKVSNVGTIAGGYVKDGKVERNAGVRVIRDNVVIHEGKLVSLKRFKDDAKEVTKGFECGLQVEGYDDIKEGDMIEVYIQEEIKRTIKKVGKDSAKAALEENKEGNVNE